MRLSNSFRGAHIHGQHLETPCANRSCNTVNPVHAFNTPEKFISCLDRTSCNLSSRARPHGKRRHDSQCATGPKALWRHLRHFRVQTKQSGPRHTHQHVAEGDSGGDPQLTAVFPVSLFVTAIADGVLAKDTQQKAKERLGYVATRTFSF